MILDDSGHRKSGNFTSVVGRQYIGEIGKVDTKFAHLDSTSFHLHGEYNNIEIAENDQKRPILITKGYSRDHRPDLKQCVLDLIFF